MFGRVFDRPSVFRWPLRSRHAEDACATGKSRIIHQMGQRVEWLCSFRRDDRLAQALLEDIPALLVVERIGWQRLLVDLLVQGRIGRNSAQ
jgi:hypothetical protein